MANCVVLGCTNRAGKSGLSFYRFPSETVRRNKWISAVNRREWTPSDYSRICSAHFISGRKSNDQMSPDYVPSLFSCVSPSTREEKNVAMDRYLRTKTRLAAKRTSSNEEYLRGKTKCAKKEAFTSCEFVSSSTRTEEIMYSSLDMLAAESKTKELEEENGRLTRRISILQQENADLKKRIKQSGNKHDSASFDPDVVNNHSIRNLFVYYTGLNYLMFLTLFNFLIPDPQKNPVQYTEQRHDIDKFTLKQQLFLVLCRLRIGFHLKDIAFRTKVKTQTIGTIFRSWIKLMYVKLGFMSFWPHRDVLISKMTPEYKKKFSNSLAIIDATEIPLERSSSLKNQSQCYSDYKSTNTLKSLVVVDSRGSVMFLSELFSGSISDNHICEKSGFYNLLSTYRTLGLINEGDAIMADKGFQIGEHLSKLGLKFNVPPYASGTSQMKPEDVVKTRQIAAHRIHVQRAINRIKRFQIVARRVPISLCHQINEIWYVCGMLTNFQDTLVKV